MPRHRQLERLPATARRPTCALMHEPCRPTGETCAQGGHPRARRGGLLVRAGPSAHAVVTFDNRVTEEQEEAEAERGSTRGTDRCTGSSPATACYTHM